MMTQRVLRQSDTNTNRDFTQSCVSRNSQSLPAVLHLSAVNTALLVALPTTPTKMGEQKRKHSRNSKGEKRKAHGGTRPTPIEVSPPMYVLSVPANEGKISDPQARLPSSSYAQRSEHPSNSGLPIDVSWRAKFDPVSIPAVCLPLSFHESTAKMAWHIQNIFQEPYALDRDEAGARARALDVVRPTQ